VAVMHAEPIMALILKGPLKDLLALLWLDDPTLSGILHVDLLFKTRLVAKIGALSIHNFFTRLLELFPSWATIFLRGDMDLIRYQF